MTFKHTKLGGFGWPWNHFQTIPIVEPGSSSRGELGSPLFLEEGFNSEACSHVPWTVGANCGSPGVTKSKMKELSLFPCGEVAEESSLILSEDSRFHLEASGKLPPINHHENAIESPRLTLCLSSVFLTSGIEHKICRAQVSLWLCCLVYVLRKIRGLGWRVHFGFLAKK